MERLNKKSGFTLLEIIIVIIIIGVLASLALPRFFKTVEYSRATEALSHLSSIRQSMQRCFLISNSFTPCVTAVPAPFAGLDVEDPSSTAAGGATAHFDYALAAPTATTFVITATRNVFEGGTFGDTITINETGVKTGTGNFSNVR